MSAESTTKILAAAGKKPGLEIWRIEKFQIVAQPLCDRGNFFEGDSYILLNTIQLRGNNMRWDLHFWLGDKSTQDERGAAAILTVQMDEALGGSPVQFRELQGFESTTFMGYFKNGVKYKQGGCASGFGQGKTNQSDVKRLLHVKGRRNVRAQEVDMSWKSFNQGDCFIVEVGHDIFQWNGSTSNRFERLKACEVANYIKNDEKAGKGRLQVLTEGEKVPSLMMKALSGSPSDIQPETKDDDGKKSESAKAATLYRVSSDTGKLVVKQVGTAPFHQASLDSGDCFIVDTGSGNSIFVWKGKDASKDERSGALSNATKFIEEKNYSAHTKIQVMVEGAESVLFTQCFKDWKTKDQTVGFGKAYSENKIARINAIRFEMSTLYDKPKLAAKHGLVDDGSGKVEVWRVEGSDKKRVDPKDHGKFFAGDSYLILYTYSPKGREEYLLYFWQGQYSTKDEIAASAFLATSLDDEYGGKPVQVRVVQGKEPAQLINIFKNRLVITSGGYCKNAGKEVGLTDVALYQVRSTTSGGTKSIQVETSAKSLNSNDAFVLKTASECYLWVGVGASDIEIEAGKLTAGDVSSATLKEIKEGSENDDFWDVLGGKQKYADSPRLQNELESNPPRLFAISNAKGRVEVEEVPGEFTQSDLEVDDVMMLDTWDEIFLWIGDGANAEEKKEAPGLVADYIRNDPRGRDADCAIVTVKMRREPVTFTGYFPSWDSTYFDKGQDYEARMQSLVLQ